MASKRAKLRIGLIGCNQRALWYGAIFDNIDPAAYAELDPAAYHHLTYYSHVELQHEQAKGFRLAKVCDSDADAARQVAAAFGGRPEVCESLDEVSDDVDLVFIANAEGDGSDHLKLATPGLTKGVATFVDRPFAATVKDARAMVALAKRKKAPLLSCSHMSMLPHAIRFRGRFEEIGPVELGTIQGHGPDPAQIADGIALALCLFGEEFGGRAECAQSMGTWPLELLHVRFAAPKTGRVLQALVVNSHTVAPRNEFFASAFSQRRPVHSDPFDAFVQPEGGLAVMNALRKMVRSGKSPLSADDMIEPVAVAEAGRKAHNAGQGSPLPS